MRTMVIVLGCLLVGACGGDGDTRVCVGSTGFCEDAFGRNREPEADAGPRRAVAAGDTVELDGGGSFDPDGRIASYSWTQRAGETVTLTDADHAVASFVAPPVTVETTLEFRLVVTDDDDASDADQVRITVRPAAAAALHKGLDLLTTAHPPPARATDPGCADCWSYLGLWIGARARAAQSADDPDELLDALRLHAQLHLDQRPDPPLPPALQRVVELGYAEVRQFTADRDPATAELAARRVPLGVTPVRADWTVALVDAYPGFVWLQQPDARRHAIDVLSAATPDAPSKHEVAAAVLVLVSR